MTEDTPFTRFVTLVDVNEATAQNVQELASIWGTVENELDEIGVQIEESYAALGAFDFLITFQAPSTDVAFQADVILERHGLDVRTIAVTPTAHFNELVEDL